MSIAFNQLIVAFPAWKQAVRGNADQWAQQYKQQLLAAFILNKIDTPAKIKHGLKIAADNDCDFLPKPAKFARWCRPFSAPYHREFPETKQLEHLADMDKFPERMAKLRKETGA
jgi:hypothetical protein